MQERIKNPAALVAGALEPLVALGKLTSQGPVPTKTLHLVHLRISQINGCAACIDYALPQQDDTPQRLALVAAWEEAPMFSAPERAALRLAESMTRIADRDNRVPDAVWAEAARHYDETGLAQLVLYVGLINLFNRCNVATRQVAGKKNW